MSRRVKIILVSVLILFFGWLSYEVFEMIYWEYRNFDIAKSSLKQYLFNDTSRSNVVTKMCKANPRDDTILCFTYRNTMVITCLKIKRYSDLDFNKINQGLPVGLEFNQGQTYEMFSGGESSPIYLSIKNKIFSTSTLFYIFNDCDSIYRNVWLRDAIFVELKCDNIGIFSENQSLDIIIETAYPENKATFLILKTTRGVFVIYGYHINNSTQPELELVSILNSHSFSALARINQ
jgi:hypothetical protein